MPITNVTLRHSKKGEVETTIVEFHLSERERPYSLYVNNFIGAEGLKSQLSGLAHVIPPIEAAQQPRALDLGWTCAKCRETNHQSLAGCGYCGEDRPSQ